MISIPSGQFSTSDAHEGPLDKDPLTENELAVLLAIPRGAETAPNATIFRLPLGPDPTQGWVDVTFSEARSIVARLAADWNSRLSNQSKSPNVGPGMVICLLVQPVVHALFHWLAFWSLGCTIQLISTTGDHNIPLYLNKSGCQVAIHSGISEAEVAKINSDFNGVMIPLPEEEYAHRLAQSNKQDQTDLTAPWPEPRRPEPAVILHSSGTTGTPKLLRFSLYFYVLGLPKSRNPPGTNTENGMPGSRPFLIFSPSYWQSFSSVLVAQLVAGTPMAFAHVLDIARLPSNQFITWAQGLDVGGTISAPRFIRDILASGSEPQINFLQGLNTIFVGGSALDESTGALADKYKLKFINGYGCTELGGLMFANQPPYTHLRPLPRSSPLIHPISDTEPDGSRQIQFWYSCSTSPQVAHLHAKGGVPLQFEPFPGDGPHKGELAVRVDDIFKEIQSLSDNVPRTSYVCLGRSDDLIKLAGNGGWDINALGYETELASAIASYLARQGNESSGWTVEGVQLFGNNRPCTALVIQLRPVNQDESKGEVGRDVLEHLSNLVEHTNTKLKLYPNQRVHPQKRMLVVASEGKAYNRGGSTRDNVPRLMMTHKHTLQRWRNVEAFGSWLDRLDYTEP